MNGKLENEPTHFASTIKNRTSRHTTKVFNRACKADPKEKLFFKNLQRIKKIKNANTQPTLYDTTTQQLQWLQARKTRTPAANSTYPKGGFSCSKDSFVVNGSLVFQIKFCGKSPALRVAAKR